MERNIFEKILGQESLFIDRKAFDHAFEPENLPHRGIEVDSLVRNLVDALNGHIPSNMLLYGVPGSGKTVGEGNSVSAGVSKETSEGCPSLF